jgi:inosine-uridine nucleoside N-ribohydrolase
MNTIPLLFDTDIGSDIDDAIALAYLLRQRRCELLGITTVTGEPEKRAMLADAVCRAAGRSDVPIHVGAGQPLAVAQRQPLAPQSETLAYLSHRTFDPTTTAVEFLRSTIQARPGEITLLAVGPLTNVAQLFTTYPACAGLLKRIVIMGGRFYSPGEEWNIACDPEAAKIVFESAAPSITAVGIDVTQRCGLDARICRMRFAEPGGPMRAVSAMAEVWFRGASLAIFHDPLATAVVFKPELCRFESGAVTVTAGGSGPAGHTVLTRSTGTEARHHASQDVDVDAFFLHYFSVVNGGV